MVGNINIGFDLAKKGNVAEAENMINSVLDGVNNIITSNKSMELIQHSSELIMYIYSNASQLQLQSVIQKIQTTPALNQAVNQYMQANNQGMQVPGF